MRSRLQHTGTRTQIVVKEDHNILGQGFLDSSLVICEKDSQHSVEEVEVT